MTEYAPLSQLRYYLQPHHIAQIINEADKIYRDCILRHPKNSEKSIDKYVRLCEKIHKPYKVVTVGFKHLFMILCLLIDKYEGIMVGETLIIRKIDVS